MNTKIKELTENIYKDGVEKAQKDGEQILEQAKQEADKIIADAKEKADTLVTGAKSESEKMYRSMKTELKAVSQQVMEITRQNITNLLASNLSDNFTEGITGDFNLMKKMILELSRKWGNGNSNNNVEVLIPESQKAAAEQLYKETAIDKLSGIKIKPVKGLKKGFQIINNGEGFKVSFTEEDFQTFFFSLVKPHMKEFLFNEENK